MAKVLYVIAPKDFRDEEYFQPREILEKAGHSVATGSTTRAMCEGMLGGTVVPNILIREARHEMFSAIVICGGRGSLALANDAALLNLINEFHQSRKLVASICLGGVVLARAGVLQGKRAVVWNDVRDRKAVEILKENGATFVDEAVVVDGNVVTAFGPEYAKDFGKTLLTKLR